MALPDGYQTLPYFPSAETFVNDGLNVRPTFFGCNASSAEVDSGMPMVIYLPNAPVGNGGYQTNTTTFQLEYSREETQNFMNSIWETMSRGYPEQGQATDPNYKACLACGIVERRRQAANLTRTQTCEQCFDRYCYNAGPADGGAMSAALHSVSPPTRLNEWLERNTLTLLALAGTRHRL
jgi:lysophospholipase